MRLSKFESLRLGKRKLNSSLPRLLRSNGLFNWLLIFPIYYIYVKGTSQPPFHYSLPNTQALEITSLFRNPKTWIVFSRGGLLLSRPLSSPLYWFFQLRSWYGSSVVERQQVSGQWWVYLVWLVSTLASRSSSFKAGGEVIMWRLGQRFLVFLPLWFFWLEALPVGFPNRLVWFPQIWWVWSVGK